MLSKPLFKCLHEKGVGIIDVHAHVFLEDGLNNKLFYWMNIFNVEKAYVSIYPFDLGSMNPSHEIVLKGNTKVLKLCKLNPRLKGMVFVNPLNPQDIDLVEKFLKIGFSGIGEVYRSTKLRGKIAESLIKLAIEYDVPILIHTAHRLYPRDRPNENTPIDIRTLAKKWPRARIIMAHITGGGDWEYALEIVKDISNVYIDIGGSVQDSGVLEKAVELLGIDRILFASDNLYAQAIGRVESANIDEDMKIKIYRENALKVFRD
jgi:predicted TIM-barrel fold metal-dependent hydrolase